MSDLSYTANGNAAYTVRRDGVNIGTVRKHGGMYWYAFTADGKSVHGSFLSMSAAGQRLSETNNEGTRKT